MVHRHKDTNTEKKQKEAYIAHFYIKIVMKVKKEIDHEIIIKRKRQISSLKSNIVQVVIKSIQLKNKGKATKKDMHLIM